MQDIFLFIQHHESLLIALAIVLAFIALLELVRQKQGAAQISPRNATLLINHQNAVIVDVRAANLFADGHIVGAVSLPLSELSNKYKKLDKFKAQPLILVCANGTESPRAAQFLKKEGFSVSLLNGGMRGWRDAEMPLIKGN